jgi:tRNA threonylcarbamoyladenosine biosynthesis protein TsaB
MIILTLRTDKPDAEVGLYDGTQQLAYETWYAHRALSVTLHQKIKDMLQQHDKQLPDVQGIVCYKGPGSFTGLRIGITVADTLAYGLNIPIVGIAGEKSWLEQGIQRLLNGQNDQITLPEYGAPANITAPRK